VILRGRERDLTPTSRGAGKARRRPGCPLRMVPRPRKANFVGLMLPVLLLEGCNSPASFFSHLRAENALLADGPSARMTPDDVEAARAKEVPLLHAFAIEANAAGVSSTTTDPAAQQTELQSITDWSAIAEVGEGYIDAQCHQFIAALNQLERSRRATLAAGNAIQSATVGIMGLAEATQKAIGITGIAFGLTSSLFDITTSSVLYQLPAASVNGVVQAQRSVLRADEPAALTNIKNQGQASARLSEYILYCSPVTIEANTGKLLGNAQRDGQGLISASPTPAAVTSAFIQNSGASSTSAALTLRQYAHDPTISPDERTRRRREIIKAAQDEGFGTIVFASWIENPPENQAQAVAARLKLTH